MFNKGHFHMWKHFYCSMKTYYYQCHVSNDTFAPKNDMLPQSFLCFVNTSIRHWPCCLTDSYFSDCSSLKTCGACKSTVHCSKGLKINATKSCIFYESCQASFSGEIIKYEFSSILNIYNVINMKNENLKWLDDNLISNVH